jgi:hypothetical protein
MDDAVAQSQMSQLIQKLPNKDKEELQRFIKGETQKSQIQQSTNRSPLSQFGTPRYGY